MSVAQIVESDGVRICSQHGELVATLGKWTGRLMYECPACGIYETAADREAAR